VRRRGLDLVMLIKSKHPEDVYRHEDVREFLGNLFLALCPLWLALFQNCRKEPIAWLRAGNGAQKVAADELINIFPDQLAGFL